MCGNTGKPWNFTGSPLAVKTTDTVLDIKGCVQFEIRNVGDEDATNPTGKVVEVDGVYKINPGQSLTICSPTGGCIPENYHKYKFTGTGAARAILTTWVIMGNKD